MEPLMVKMDGQTFAVMVRRPPKGVGDLILVRRLPHEDQTKITFNDYRVTGVDEYGGDTRWHIEKVD